MATSTEPSANNWGENRNFFVVERRNKGLTATSSPGRGGRAELLGGTPPNLPRLRGPQRQRPAHLRLFGHGLHIIIRAPHG
eukprot:379836-Prorocentrum_minimum.AAC.1